MMKPAISVKTKTDNRAKAAKVIAAFEAQRVLVGIPSTKNDRHDVRSGTELKGLNNATIGAIMEKGSSKAHIPARPWLKPGIQSAHAKIIARYEHAAKTALKTLNVSPLATAHDVVGQETAAAVRHYIKTTGLFVPLKPATILARARQRGTGVRPAETHYRQLLMRGVPANIAMSMAGIRPLINTGQFVGAISYVVRKKGEPGYARGTKSMRRIDTSQMEQMKKPIAPKQIGNAAKLGEAGEAAAGAGEAAEAVAGVAEAAAVVAIL